MQCPQATFVARFHEFMHESSGRGEGDALVFLAGGQPQCQGDVGFAGAGRPERDTILSLLDPFAAREFENQHFIGQCQSKLLPTGLGR